jgi:hypothetical protein
MKRLLARFARWLLTLCEPQKKPIAGPIVYALVRDGDQVADVSTNKHRVQAEATAAACRGEDVVVLRYVPVGRWSPEPAVRFREAVRSPSGEMMGLDALNELIRKTGGE